MMIFQEHIVELAIVYVLLHRSLELCQLLLCSRHLGRRYSYVDLWKRHSTLGLARALGSWLCQWGAFLLVVWRLSLSVNSVAGDFSSEDTLVLLVQIVDVDIQPILLICQIIVNSKRGDVFSIIATILWVWQRFNMSAVDLLRVVAPYPEWRGLELVPQRRQVRWSLVQSILVELNKALSLARLNLLSFNCGINSSVSGRSPWVFQ